MDRIETAARDAQQIVEDWDSVNAQYVAYLRGCRDAIDRQPDGEARPRPQGWRMPRRRRALNRS